MDRGSSNKKEKDKKQIARTSPSIQPNASVYAGVDSPSTQCSASVYAVEYDELRACGLSDQDIHALRNTGAAHAAIVLYAQRRLGYIQRGLML